MLSDTVRQRAKFLLMRRVKQAEEEGISSWCDVQDKTTLTQLSDLSSCSMLGHGQFTVIVRKGQLLQFIILLTPTKKRLTIFQLLISSVQNVITK